MVKSSAAGLAMLDGTHILSFLMYFCSSYFLVEASGFQVFDTHKRKGHSLMTGRIPEFDDLVKRRVVDIAKRKGMDSVILEAERLFKSTKGKKELAQYYIDVLHWIKKEGTDGIAKERKRISNILITDKMSYEFDYARKRISILNSFTDAMAEQILKEMSGSYVDLSNIPQGADLAEVIKERKKNGILHKEG